VVSADRNRHRAIADCGVLWASNLVVWNPHEDILSRTGAFDIERERERERERGSVVDSMDY